MGWLQPGYDDGAWESGVSGFSFGGSSYEATALTGFDTNKCLFLRCGFQVDQLADIAWLILRIDYSGGFVAWLNGVEIVRRGLEGPPGTQVPSNAQAQPHDRGTPEEIDCSHHLPHMREGANVLAIQWHHSAGSSAHATALVPELLANFTRGPYLQNTSASRQHILWKTLIPADGFVEYGLTTNPSQTTGDAEPVCSHEVMLTNLEPDTLYYYRVSSQAGGQRALSPVFTFRTLRESGPFSFTIMADMGLGSAAQYRIADVIRGSNPDLVLGIGDLVYPSYTAGREDIRFFSVYGPHMRGTPYFVVAGNHDTEIGVEKDFYAAFLMPTNNVSPETHAAASTGPEHYYSFDHGEAHLVGLYVPIMSGRFALTNGSPQLGWLDGDLASSTKPWKFVFLHHPVITSNGHRRRDYNANGILDCEELAKLLWPLASRYGVQMILSGHAHSYERSNPVAGVYSIVSGGGGGPLYGLTELDAASAQFWSRYECVRISGDNEQLQIQALADDEQVFDTMFIRRTPLPYAPSEAAWGKPEIEIFVADDGDGNLIGQTFDFAGTPIPTLPGDSSNLGRVWVNRDHDHLYLGFEQVMLYPDNTLFVFIETPNRSGVGTLAGLGNGLVDPEGEGVDGLDFLENLDFADFSPSLACVLGDEFADRQSRSFLRTNYFRDCTSWPCAEVVSTNLGLNTGQGVFWLDAKFSSLNGVRLQQFNRSPQVKPVPGEQNANFVELAIPLADLGLRNGGRIKLGAVVAGGQFDTSSQWPRLYLDRGHLGLTMTGSGLDPVVLQGVTVEIGPDLDQDSDGLTIGEETEHGTDPMLADSDNDGLPDGYEVRYGLDPIDPEGEHGIDGDQDKDGFTNFEEWQAGTDPHDAESVLKLFVEPLVEFGVMMTWQAAPDRRYQVHFKSSLDAEFEPRPAFETPRPPTAKTESFVDTMADHGEGTSGYYRLLVSP